MTNTKKFYAGIYNRRFEFSGKVMSIEDKEYKMWKFLYILIISFSLFLPGVLSDTLSIKPFSVFMKGFNTCFGNSSMD